MEKYKKEIEFIRENLNKLGRKKCREILNLTPKQIDGIISRKIPSKKVLEGIGEDTIKYLKDNYHKIGNVGCGKNLNLSVSKIYICAQQLGLKVDKENLYESLKNKENLSHFYSIDNYIIAYLFGFLWADGHVSQKNNLISLKIKKEDFDYIGIQLRSTAKSWRYYERQPKGNRKVQSLLEINHEGLNTFLLENDYGIKSGASADKILSKIPEDLRHYWWRGYFDGDGTSGKNCVALCSCYDQNWEFAISLFNDLDIKSGLYRGIGKLGHKRSEVIISNLSGIQKFYNYIYNGQQIGLDRKKNKILKFIESKSKL